MVNQIALANLEAQIGRDAVMHALDLLVTDLKTSAEALAACLDSGDEARARRTGHKLKGILDQYGIRDPQMAASNLATRYDLYWVSECTSLFALCQTAVDETRRVLLARAASNDDAAQARLQPAM